jgi:hypothetical protein
MTTAHLSKISTDLHLRLADDVRLLAENRFWFRAADSEQDYACGQYPYFHVHGFRLQILQVSARYGDRFDDGGVPAGKGGRNDHHSPDER